MLHEEAVYTILVISSAGLISCKDMDLTLLVSLWSQTKYYDMLEAVSFVRSAGKLIPRNLWTELFACGPVLAWLATHWLLGHQKHRQVGTPLIVQNPLLVFNEAEDYSVTYIHTYMPSTEISWQPWISRIWDFSFLICFDDSSILFYVSSNWQLWNPDRKM
jgi:hypothetical protein